MESSGQRPDEPEVPLGDATIAAEIARAAAKGRGSDRAPTLEQLLAAFGEHAPTDAARRRVAAALRMADLGVRPELLDAEPGQRLLLLPPGAAGGRGRGRLVLGLLALAAVLVGAVIAAALIGTGSNDQRASDGLPAGPASSAAPATVASSSTAPSTTASTATPPDGATTTTPTPTETGPASTTDQQAQADAVRQAQAQRRRQRAAQRRRAAAGSLVTVRVDATGRPTFLCVDDGSGKVLFSGTLDGKQTFKARRVRMNVGLASTTITVNGNPVRLPGSPAGVDITRQGGARDLPLGQRPCA
jgi:hypothetical protein